MFQYNLLAIAKRFSDYETIGESVRTAQKDFFELRIYEKIWLIIIEIVSRLLEILNFKTEVLMAKLISEKKQLTKYLDFKPLLQVG
jgi:hypothetical protein